MAKKSNKQSQSEKLFADVMLKLETVQEPQYGKGEQRPYLISTIDEATSKSRNIQPKEKLTIALLLVLGLGIRFYGLGYPDSVVFDEVHFGAFAKKYIKHEFFMDVHPPLAKMLFAFVAYFAGFKGDFDFKKIGDTFPETTPYYFMRLLSASMGVGTVLLCYLSLRKSGCKPIVCWVTAFALIIENANATISRYILLDSPLIFFIAASVYSWVLFLVQVPFTFAWYKNLIICGVFLGLSLSSKWVGLFTVAWVGVCSLYQLWFIIGDLTVKPREVLGHAFARAFLLLSTAATLYLIFFNIHLNVLFKDGDGSPFMSSAFRATLEGNKIPRDILANVGFGSVVSIRHIETDGGYLHSHNHFYPAGSKQQQVTLYPHLDSNNDWIIEPFNTSIPEGFVPIEDGIKIRLKHANTGRRLHSHDEKPPVSERDWQKEVSCYGYEGFGGDANDDFFVEIVKYRTPKGKAQNEVRALETVFRLRHVMTGNYLFSSPAKLPDWGFDQQEVSCASQGYRPLTHWYIETNVNPRVNDTIKEIVNYPVPSFLDKFVELHKKMWTINQGLTGHHNWQSSPIEWPVLTRGINYWVKDHRQVYFIGNVLTWWLSSLAIITFAIHSLVSLVRWQTGAKIAKDKHVFNFNSQVFLYAIGWLLHYAPFFIMGRQLFLHHYLPAAYFAILTLGHFLDIFVSYILARNSVLRKISYGVLGVYLIGSILIYVHYSSLIYAQPWTKEQCNSSKLLSSWDFDCPAFLESYSEYSTFGLNTSSPIALGEQAIETENAENIEIKKTVGLL